MSFSDDLQGGFFIAHGDVFGMPLMIGVTNISEVVSKIPWRLHRVGPPCTSRRLFNIIYIMRTMSIAANQR